MAEIRDLIRFQESSQRINPRIDKRFVHSHDKSLILENVFNRIGCSPAYLLLSCLGRVEGVIIRHGRLWFLFLDG